jgi:hypothetical protein
MARLPLRLALRAEAGLAREEEIFARGGEILVGLDLPARERTGMDIGVVEGVLEVAGLVHLLELEYQAVNGAEESEFLMA